ncbi:uncharacterized protein ATNIH1004_009649 [Aspergillus tanneri]|uniref:Major facilitator superfamily (MFS) profile domain-containing protein n=1 Tax=Aspergillus tanneri TaxID=1220188 RepID=A0A5M9M7W3_9EURO|nr:uncharacterized protein ATNIH1004_009649 [Aspergillus tanneri]KAA8642888.1 hypothetical protein ATNIH1004_009649 [Aspergillus tanneri]
MSVARVASNIASISAYPIIAKLGDVAAVFHSMGTTGFGLTQQVFIADVTNLINRGLWSTLPDSISTIPTLYLGKTAVSHGLLNLALGLGDRRQNATFIALMVAGIVLLILFVLWDILFAKKPFIPYKMVKSKTVAAACLLGALDFLHYSMFTVFYSSYLQVVGGYSPGHATRIE